MAAASDAFRDSGNPSLQSTSPASDAFHESVKNLVLVGWSWALAVVTAWWGASQWRGRARTRELLLEQEAPELDVVEALSFFHAEPLSVVFFLCTVALSGVLQKLALLPLTTIGLPLVGMPVLPWLTPQLVASLWAVADIVTRTSFAGLLPIAYFYCETENSTGISGRLRDASKSLALLCGFILGRLVWLHPLTLSFPRSDGLLGALLVTASRLLSTDLRGAASLLLSLADLPLYFFCLMAASLGAEIGFRRVRDAWIPLDLKDQLEARNEAIEMERQMLRQRLELLGKSSMNPPQFRKVSSTIRLPKAPSFLEVDTNETSDLSQKRSRSLSSQRSLSRSREAVNRYARHVSLNGLLSPGGPRFPLPRSPLSDSPVDKEGIEQQVEDLDFEEMVNLNTMKVPFVAWNIGCAAIFGCLLVGWVSLGLHTAQGLTEWLGIFPTAIATVLLPRGIWFRGLITLLGAIAQAYLIITTLTGFYALRLFSALRNNRSSFPHLILGLILLSGFALSVPQVAADLHVFRVAGYARLGGWAGRIFAVLFLARLTGRGRPRFS